jgi:hypothetical protein
MPGIGMYRFNYFDPAIDLGERYGPLPPDWERRRQDTMTQVNSAVKVFVHFSLKALPTLALSMTAHL